MRLEGIFHPAMFDTVTVGAQAFKIGQSRDDCAFIFAQRPNVVHLDACAAGDIVVNLARPHLAMLAEKLAVLRDESILLFAGQARGSFAAKMLLGALIALCEFFVFGGGRGLWRRTRLARRNAFFGWS